MPANDLSLVSGSQTYTGQIGTGNPDTLYNLTGNADLLLKTSSGTILDISTTIGTIPDEINVSELAAEDNSLLVLSPGGDTDYNPSQKLGEVANSEKLVVDPLTGSNSEPPATTIASNNPSEKSNDSTDLITGYPVENQDATAPRNTLTGTIDDTNSTDKITETDSEIGITSATEKFLGETLASPDKSSNEITNLETKTSPEKPITSDSETTDSLTRVSTTESPDKSTDSAASEIISETTKSPDTTISNSVESAAASNTENAALSNGETNNEATIAPLTQIATISETGAEFKEIVTSPSQLTNSVESTAIPDLVTGEFVENPTEKSPSNSQITTLSNAEDSQEESLTLSSDKTTILPEVKPLPTSEDKPDIQLEITQETVASNGTNSNDLTGSFTDKKTEESSSDSANNNPTVTTNLPDDHQSGLAEEETKIENHVIENSITNEPKETVAGDKLTTEKPVDTSSETTNTTNTEKNPAVNGGEEEKKAEDEAEVSSDETQKELNPTASQPELTASPDPFTSGKFKVDTTGKVGIDFLFDGGLYQGQLAIFSLKGMAIFIPGSEAFIKEATARALSKSVQGHVVISDLSEGARFSGKLGEENFNSGEYLGVKTFDMTPGDEFGVMIVPNGTVQEVFDNPGIGGNKRPLFSMATANPENGMQIGQIADVTGEGNTFSMEDLRVDGWTDKDYNDFVFQVRGAIGKAVLMDDVVAAGKDWRTSDLGKALVDYAKAYITPELVDEQADIAPTDNTSTTGVIDPLREDDTNNNNNTPTTGVIDPLREDETSNNNNTPTTGVIDPLSEDETSNNSNTPTTGLAESTDETKTGNDSVIDRTNLTDNNSAIVEKEIPTVTEPVLSNVTKSVEASVGSTGTPTVTNTIATTPGANAGDNTVKVTATPGANASLKPVAPVTNTDIVTGNKPVTPVTNTDIVTGNKPVAPAVGSTVVKTGETSNVVTSTVPTVTPTNSTQTTTTVNSQVTPATVGSNVTPTVAATAVTTAPTYNFPPADQPLVSAINKELLPNSGNWEQSLIEFVDNAKISPQPNAVVNINLDLTQILPDGSVAPRYELTSKEEEAIAYAQKHNILVVVPVGDRPAQVSALGQLSKQYDNIIAVGAAKRVNDAIAPFKAFAPAPDSGRGEALNILADVSGEGAGTSLAAAKVTEAASSVWAANPKLNYTQVIDLLKRTATDLGKPNWDVDTGAGLLNVAAAVNLAKATQPEPYTVKPGQQTITDNFISQNNAAKVLPGIPTHPAVTPPGVPQTAADQGANNLSGTPIQISSTQDVIDQVSAIDPADVYRVESRYLAGSEFSVLSGQLSVSFVTPTGQVLGSQVFAAGNHTLQLPAGVPNEVLVKIDSQGGAPATYRLKGFESQAPEPFNIDLEFVGGLTASQQAIMQAAAKSVASLIGKGLPSAIVDGKIIDDINIKVSTANIDGGNGTQAQTKIDFMRYGTLLPAQSITQFDAADIGKLESSGELFSVAQHEFLHALGFGNLWEAKGLVDYAGTPLAQYNGKQAVQEFSKLGGATNYVPLETEGDGSADLHWNEELFQDEVMTYDLGSQPGEKGQVTSPISPVSIASLADLGYQVNLNQATPKWGLFGEQFNPENVTEEWLEEQWKRQAEVDPRLRNDGEINLPTIDLSKVAPDIWAHAERAPNGEYYDWQDYVVSISGDSLSMVAQRTMGSGSESNWRWIAAKNGITKAPYWIYLGDNIQIPVHHPNYEQEQEAERQRREQELQQRQEQEARERQQQEDRIRNDQAEQERLRQDEERRRQEAEANQRALEEQARRLAEEQERRRREREEYEREQARLAELRRQAEIARQQGKGGLEWYLAKPMPEFGPVDPFETSLTGETVGNLVPDDYYRFTLSRGGRITAELRQLLADADLVLYDVRNEPIAYSMREGITDEQIIADLIPGTYMLRVNSPKGVTTDYDLVVKFQHKLSATQTQPLPPGWRPTSIGGNPKTPLHANPTEANPLRGFLDPLNGSGTVTQGNGGSTSHTGRAQYAIDYGVPIGTPVYAMRSGTVVGVVDKYPDTGGGYENRNNFNYVLIEHDGGYRSAYLHLQQGSNSRIGLKVGDTVNAGELIGYSGNSGWSTGPHLHVEVHQPTAGGYFGQTVPFVIGGDAAGDDDSSSDDSATDDDAVFVGSDPTLPPVAGTTFGKQARVGFVDPYLSLWDSPNKTNRLDYLGFNDILYVAKELPGGWYEVATVDGKVGYVDKNYVITQHPEQGASLHRITSGETAIGIAEKYYKNLVKPGEDLRFFVNALAYANQGMAGIYYEGKQWKDVDWSNIDWTKVKVRADHDIWIPSGEFMQRLRGQVASGSITGGLWANTVQWANENLPEWAKYGAAYVGGIFHGATDSILDVFRGLWDLGGTVVSLVKSLLGDIALQAKALIEQISQANWSELFSSLGEDFKSRFFDPDPWKAGHFSGWVIGYALAEILSLIFTGGISAIAKYVGKLGKMVKWLTKLPIVSKLINKASDFGKALQFVLKGRKAVKIEQMEQSVRELAGKLKFTNTTLERMENPDRYVPRHILADAIDNAIKNKKTVPDPQKAPGAVKITEEMWKINPKTGNYKKYELEIIYRDSDQTVLHFLYK